MLIEDIIVCRLLLSYLLSKLDIKIELLSFEEITNQDKLHKFMDSMINAAGNMETPMSGNVLLNYLTTYPSLLLSKISSFVFMVDCLQALKHLTISEL